MKRNVKNTNKPKQQLSKNNFPMEKISDNLLVNIIGGIGEEEPLFDIVSGSVYRVH